MSLLGAVLLVTGAAGVAEAHSGLAAASPGPGATVGGEVAEIRIFYGDVVTAFDATVTNRSTGDVVDVEAELLSDVEAVVRLAEPLREDGEYAVRHTITSIDSDVVEAAYLFTYDAAAPPPQLVFVDDEGGGGLPWFAWVLFVVGAIVIFVLAWRLVAAIRRRHPPTSQE